MNKFEEVCSDVPDLSSKGYPLPRSDVQEGTHLQGQLSRGCGTPPCDLSHDVILPTPLNRMTDRHL